MTYAVAAIAHSATTRDGPEETIDADAARLHGDELAVGGQPAERDQQGEQHRNRNADAERLRQQQHHDARHNRQLHAFGDELIPDREDGRNHQEERQQQQRQEERQQDFADDISIEDREHSLLDYNV